MNAILKKTPVSFNLELGLNGRVDDSVLTLPFLNDKKDKEVKIGDLTLKSCEMIEGSESFYLKLFVNDGVKDFVLTMHLNFKKITNKKKKRKEEKMIDLILKSCEMTEGPDSRTLKLTVDNGGKDYVLPLNFINVNDKEKVIVKTRRDFSPLEWEGPVSQDVIIRCINYLIQGSI